jgi:hypothetical protein
MDIIHRITKRHRERSVAIPYLQSGMHSLGLPRYARNDVFFDPNGILNKKATDE